MVKVQPVSGEPGAWLLAVKAVPGARCDAIVGPYADRLKVRVAAPPEDGKANKSICRLLAGALGVRPGAITVVSGLSAPEKTVRIEGTTPAAIRKMIETKKSPITKAAALGVGEHSPRSTNGTERTVCCCDGSPRRRQAPRPDRRS